MRASIIIPAYGMEQWLDETIQSALAQTHRDTEVVVVDDGSTDNTRSIMFRYPIKRVCQANKGLSGARNAGIMNSTGDVILPLDADDWIEPTYLEETIPLMTRGVGVVATDYQMFGNASTYVKMEPVTLTMLMKANRIPVCSLIRREALLETGGYNSRLEVYEDWNQWIEIMKRGWDVAVLNRCLFHYRVRAGSLVTQSVGHHEELHGRIRDTHPDLW